MRKADERPRDKSKRRGWSDNVQRSHASIWNALRQREASNREELRAQITLPRLKFLEKPELKD